MKIRYHYVLFFLFTIITECSSSKFCQEQEIPVLPFLFIFGTGMTMGSMMCPTCPVINCPTNQSTCPPTVSTSTSTIQPTTTGQSCDVNELQALRDEIVEWNFCQTIANSEDCNNNARCTLNVNCGPIQNK